LELQLLQARLARAMEKHQLAWIEDMIPWQFTDFLKKITDAVEVPILTGVPHAAALRHYA